MPFPLYLAGTPEATKPAATGSPKAHPKWGSRPADPARHGGRAPGVLTEELQDTEEEEQALHSAAGCQPSPPQRLPGRTLDPPQGHMTGSARRRL